MMTKKEIEVIKSKVENKDIIYFDCFDTIVYRKYSTKYVFYRLAEFLIQEYSVGISFEYVQKSLQSFFVECDIPFRKIARNVYLHFFYNIDIDENEFVSKFGSEFIKAELDNIELAPNVLELLKWMIAKKKKLYILSDFYFGKKELKLLLGSLMDVSIFEDIIVSADLGKTKYKGDLYDCVLEPHDSIMVGDNELNDYKRPIECGIDAIKINSKKQYLKYNQYTWNYTKNQKLKLLNVKETNKQYFCANYAYEMYAFCKKLYNRLHRDDTVLFLARDGLFMKQCFDFYLENRNQKNITTKYLEVSRLALLMLVWNFERETAHDFAKAFSHRSDWKVSSAEELLHFLGFNQQEFEDYITSSSGTQSNYFQTLEYEDLYNNQRFKQAIKRKQRSALNKFLNLIVVNSNQKRIITVDMGWKGTSQNDMRKVIPEQFELYGYYFGTTMSVGELPNSIKEGLIFDYRDRVEVYDDSFHELEALLKTDKGQLVCYTEDGNVYVQDNGVRVYDAYSKICQQKAMVIFQMIKETDLTNPVSVESLISTAKDIKQKQSIKSLVWGRFYFDLQGNNDVKRKKPYFKDYKFAAKMFLYRKIPSLYYIKRRYKN